MSNYKTPAERYTEALATASDEVLAVLADDFEIDGADYDNTDSSSMPELEDAMNLHVGYLAHWRTPSLVWAGDGVGPKGWDALAWRTKQDKLATAKDKAAFPYLWNAKRQRVNLSSTRSYNAARGRMLAGDEE